MDLVENIIANWFNSRGYFVFQNLRIGVNEVDLLAILLNQEKKVAEALQVEIQCSTNPIGYIGGSSSARRRSPSEIKQGVEDYIEKKFNNKKTRAVVEKLIGKNYKKLLICGKLKDETTVNYFKENGIDVIRVCYIFNKVEENKGVFKTGDGNRYHQLLHLNNMDRNENKEKAK